MLLSCVLCDFVAPYTSCRDFWYHRRVRTLGFRLLAHWEILWFRPNSKKVNMPFVVPQFSTKTVIFSKPYPSWLKRNIVYILSVDIQLNTQMQPSSSFGT